jgi:hypothetical protein
MILALGGSKRTRNLKNVMSASSTLLISEADPIFLYAMPRPVANKKNEDERTLELSQQEGEHIRPLLRLQEIRA